MASKTQRTYSSKRNKKPAFPPSSPISASSSSPAPEPTRKRLHVDIDDVPASKRARKETRKPQEKQKTLTQLHFCIDQPILRQCPLCELSYTKGAQEDESLHRAHCARVQRVMEWGREEAREAAKAGVEEVAADVKLNDGQKGRIICIRATAGGKIGAKLSNVLKIVNTALSSPALESQELQTSKAYLLLLPIASSTTTKEKIVGCVIAQRISTAMAIVASADASSTEGLVHIDTSVFCDPKPLSTPVGIARIFTAKPNRRLGVASKLLSAVAETFIQGCVVDPQEGEVAFTQTTGDGLALMRKWGGEKMRIYEE